MGLKQKIQSKGTRMRAEVFSALSVVDWFVKGW